jgi:L-asparaginase / beta-aspartyl-peptidase
LRRPVKGTVGAVALDVNGNLASATSTGGTSGSLPGRIGDSCIIGAGCYANNKTCAVSGTGDGEFLITRVIAHSISQLLEAKLLSVQEACDYIIHKKNKFTKADMGVISIAPNGNIGISFNSERMHRAWIDKSGNVNVKIYE